jgi:hypothetical protein
MRKPTLLVHLLLFAVALACYGKPKTSLTVRATTHASRVNEYTSTYTTPGTSNTHCSGSGSTVGNTTDITADCQTTSTPAQTHSVTTSTVDVVNTVEAGGIQYKIARRANWVGSNCGPLTDGDLFQAEIDGNTMWILAHKDGNQGPRVRIKYRVLDIRPASSNPPLRTQGSRPDFPTTPPPPDCITEPPTFSLEEAQGFGDALSFQNEYWVCVPTQ